MAEAARGAHADDRPRPGRPFREFEHRLGEDARPGGAERVSERDAPAVGVDPVARKRAEAVLHGGTGGEPPRVLEGRDRAQDLRRERLVELPQPDVLERESVAMQQFGNRDGRGDEEPLAVRIDGGLPPVEEARPRQGVGKRGESRLGRDPARRGSVRQRRGVARRERSHGAGEGGAKAGELLHRRPGAREGVAIDGEGAGRDEEPPEERALIPGGALVTRERESVLGLARDVPFAGHLLGVPSHRLPRRSLLHRRRRDPEVAGANPRQRPHHARRAARAPRAPDRPAESRRESDLRVTRRFHAAAEDEVRPSHGHLTRAVGRGGDGGGARLDDALGRDARLETRVEPHLAAPVAHRERGDDRAPQEEIDPPRVLAARTPVSRHRLLDDRGGQRQTVEARKFAIDLRKRTAEAGEDEGGSGAHAWHPIGRPSKMEQSRPGCAGARSSTGSPTEEERS